MAAKRLAAAIAIVFISTLFGVRADAATYYVSAGAATSAIQSAINTAASDSSGGTVQIAAGQYSITSSLNVPCPSVSLTITGPVVAPANYNNGSGYTHWGYTPTATLNPSAAVANSGWVFSIGPCSAPITIQYLETNGGQQNPDGGGAVFAEQGVSNLTIQYNFFHGNWANPAGGNSQDGLIYFNGNQGTTTIDSNNTVQWNRLGATGDCQNIMSGENYDGNSEQLGGYCNAISSRGANTNFTIQNNVIYYQEQGFKFWQGPCVAGGYTAPGAAPCTTPTNQLWAQVNKQVRFNDVSYIHRIGYESQQQPVNAYLTSNVWHDAYLAGLGYYNGSWMVSVPEGSNGTCGTYVCDPGSPGDVIADVFIYDIAVGGFPGPGGNVGTIASAAGPTVEFWGAGNFQNNFVQGYAGCMMQFGYYNGVIQNNIARMYNVNSNGFTCNEEGITDYPAGSVQAGSFSTYNYGVNSGGGTSWQAQLTSIAPTISPSSGSFSGSHSVTFTDAGVTSSSAFAGYSNGYGPLGNTTIWYTTDGSTPVPGSGTATPIASGQSITTSAATIKAVGMYGAPNQIVVYPSGFGFVPSAVVTASYSGGSGGGAPPTPTAATPTINPGTETVTGSVSPVVSSSTPSATIACTANGTALTAAASPATFGPFTSNTALSCYATASGYLQSATASATYTVNTSSQTTITVPAGSSTSTIQSAINSAAAASSGGIVSFSAGVSNIPWTSQITLTCPVNSLTLTGPVTTYDQPGVQNSWNARPSATLRNTTTGESPQLFVVNGGCQKPINVYYLEIDGNHPSSGGGAFYINGGSTNGYAGATGPVTLKYDFIHGNQELTPASCGIGCATSWDDENATLIDLEGGQGGSTIGPVVTADIEHNILGATVAGNPAAGDCGNLMSVVGFCTGSTSSDSCNFVGNNTVGGYCSALGVHTSTYNTIFNYNTVTGQEQPQKWFESGAYPNYNFETNDVTEYNDFSGYIRIGIEDQSGPTTYVGGSVPGNCPSQANNACQQRKYNDVHDQVNPNFGNWGFSEPHTAFEDDTDNVMISNTKNGSGTAGPGNFEWWASTPSVNDHNLEQGYISCGTDFGYGVSSSTSISYNQFEFYNANSSNCSATNSSGQVIVGAQAEFSAGEGLPSTNYPAFNGNTYSSSTSANISVAPTISPNGGTYSGPVVVTLTDTGNVSGVGPRGNTNLWCTQDGSTPVPKSGTSVYYPSGYQLTISSSTTLTCVGMWGAQNQPASYPAGYGYVPSAAVSAVFNISGSGGGPPVTPTVNAPTISPAGPYVFSSALTLTISQNTGGAVSHCTLDGSTPTASSNVYSSINLTSTTTVSCISTLAGYNNSSVVGPYVYTYSLYLGNTNNNVNIGTYQNATNAVYAVTGSGSGSTTTVSGTNIDTSLTGWSTCVLSACNPGGTGVPSGTAQTIGNSSPSGAPGGTSMALSETAPSSASNYTNALWTNKASTTCDNCINFSDSFSVYLGSNSAYASAFEWDMFDFALSLNTEFMLGMQWYQGGNVWQVFNQATGQWVNTSVTAALSYSTWHHIQRTYHRVAGDTNGCSGQPCMYYDTLTIDGTTYNLNMTEPAGPLPNTWTSAIGWQAQIDIEPVGATQTVQENIAQVSFAASGPGYSVSSGNVCLGNGVVTSGAKTDVILAQATSPTGQAAAALCYGTWTNPSSAGPGCVTVAMSGCPTLTPNTAYWIETVTNDPLGPSPLGGWNCGGACGSTVPTVGNGTYTNFFGGLNYGGPYTSLPTTLSPGTSQTSVWLNLSGATQTVAATPVISPPTTTFAVGSTQQISISDTTPGATIHYTLDGSTPTAASPVYNGTVSVSSTTTISAIAYATGYSPSPISTATYTATAATFSYAYIEAASAVNYTVLGQTADFVVVIGYSDGSQTQVSCAGSGCADTRGTYISSWSSATPATGTINSGGIFTPVALGSTFLQANLTYTGGTGAAFWVEYVSPSANIGLYGVSLYGVDIQ